MVHRLACNGPKRVPIRNVGVYVVVCMVFRLLAIRHSSRYNVTHGIRRIAMDEFETALRAEISILREKAVELTARREALELALTMYEERRPSRSSRRTSTARPGSQSATVMKMIREAGSAGLTSSEINGWIEEEGLTIQPGTVRSLLYEKKKSGVLEQTEEGRYRFTIGPAENGIDHPTSEDVLDHWTTTDLDRREKEDPTIL